MNLRRTLTTGLILALAATTACKEEKKAAKPVEKAVEAPAQPEKKAEPEKVAEPEKKPEDKAAMADLKDLQPNAVPAQSMQGLDGVTQFSLGDDKQGCEQYGKDVSAFFTAFGTEFKNLESTFSPDANGVAAMRKFSSFLKNGVGQLKAIKVDGDALAQGHTEFVASIEDLAGGFDQLASGIEAGDQAQTQAAATRVQNAVNNFKTTLTKLVSICGE